MSVPYQETDFVRFENQRWARPDLGIHLAGILLGISGSSLVGILYFSLNFGKHYGTSFPSGTEKIGIQPVDSSVGLAVHKHQSKDNI